MPSNARRRFNRLVDLQPMLLEGSEKSPWNKLTMRGPRGVIASGLALNYVHEALGGDDEIHVTGSAFDDSLTVAAALVPVTFQGGSGNDTLIGADIANVWMLTAQDAGVLNEVVAFSGASHVPLPQVGSGQSTAQFVWFSPNPQIASPQAW